MKQFPVALIPGKNGKTEKKPLVKWKDEASDDPKQLAAWARLYPQCAWGAATGKEAGYWVLDADVKNNGLENVKNLPGWPWDTLTVKTPSGGMHWYFSYPEHVAVRQTQGLVDGVDTRSDGGFIVTPSTLGYDIVKNQPMSEAPPELTLLVASQSSPIQDMPRAEGEGPRGKLNSRSLTFLAMGTEPGTWHQELVQCLMNMKQQGWSEEQARELVEPLLERHDRLREHGPQIADIFNKRTPSYESTAAVVVKAQDLIAESAAFLADPKRSQGEPTLLPELDKLLGGGKRPGELTVTVAEAKTGKNSVWHWLMAGWLDKGHGVAYASQELSPMSEVVPNLLSIKLGRNVYKQPYSPEEAQAAMANWQLVFTEDTGPLPGDGVFDWMDACRDMGIKWYFIDHYHFLLDNPEDFQEGSKFIRRLKRYARRYEVHIDLIVQPKVLQTGERLSLNSARGGAAIGQALDNLLLMERERDATGKRMNVVKVRLEVARSKLADPGEFFLSYDKEKMIFEVVEQVVVAPDGAPLDRGLTYGKQVG